MRAVPRRKQMFGGVIHTVGEIDLTKKEKRNQNTSGLNEID